MPEPIVRIAARGDGVTEAGRHVAFGVPGDVLLDDGTLQHGPDHQVPPCRHFPECGGCQLQHVSDAAYRDYLISRITTALDQHGIAADVRDPHLSPPNGRRRATLHALRVGSGVVLGFNAAKSHRIVDMQENHILCPELLALLDPLRRLLGSLLQPKCGAQVQMTLADQGVDLLLKGVKPQGLAGVEALTSFCERNTVARLSLDQGYGPEAFYEPVPATVTLSGTPVLLPAGAFLQATQDGEQALVEAVVEAVHGAARTADLFAGLGTFALALKGQVYAAEASRDAVLSLKRAAAHIAVEHRDLYRRPLDGDELSRLEALVLDPPRSGAEAQIRNIAAAAIPKVAYVSCNPATFGRDARLLIAGGYRIDWVQPVGQFRWSTHVELAAAFVR